MSRNPQFTDKYIIACALPKKSTGKGKASAFQSVYYLQEKKSGTTFTPLKGEKGL